MRGVRKNKKKSLARVFQDSKLWYNSGQQSMIQQRAEKYKVQLFKHSRRQNYKTTLLVFVAHSVFAYNTGQKRIIQQRAEKHDTMAVRQVWCNSGLIPQLRAALWGRLLGSSWEAKGKTTPTTPATHHFKSSIIQWYLSRSCGPPCGGGSWEAPGKPKAKRRQPPLQRTTSNPR